jgi:hypothetical protein
MAVENALETKVATALQPIEQFQLATVLWPREGSRAADIGAGKGKYAVELGRLVGPTGHVFATESELLATQRRLGLRYPWRLNHLVISVCPPDLRECHSPFVLPRGSPPRRIRRFHVGAAGL